MVSPFETCFVTYTEKILFEKISLKNIFYWGDFLSRRFSFEKTFFREDFLSRRFSLEKMFLNQLLIFLKEITFSNSGINKVAMVKNALLPMSL
jgi:hypothetical protein